MKETKSSSSKCPALGLHLTVTDMSYSAGGTQEQIYAAYAKASTEFKKGNDDLNSMIYSAKVMPSEYQVRGP